MISIDSNKFIISQLPDITKYNAIGVGPGIGKDESTAIIIKKLLKTAKTPLVLDADALNIISAKKWHDLIPENSILTPHPKEFERLFGKTENSIQRLNFLKENAVKYKLVIILKGAHTAIATPDGQIYFNNTGNPGMATAGSGDVLTGIITALLAQKYSSKEAAILGVWLHGKAGDLAAEDLTEECVIASDIINYLPQALKKLKK
jgi:NAD(P)H-hydrate epimerase